MKRRPVRKSREEQLRIFETVKRMLLEGGIPREIAAATRVAPATVYKYRDMSEPPGPVGNAGGHRPTKYSTRPVGLPSPPDGREFVHPEIAALRDQLVAAFMRRDLEEHGRLTLLLKVRLIELNLSYVADADDPVPQVYLPRAAE